MVRPNYALQQTGATGIRLCPSVRLLKFKFTNLNHADPPQLNAER